MLKFRELEHSDLYAGLGVQLIDELESVPATGFEAGPFGWTEVEVLIDEGGGTFRPIEPAVVRTPSGVIWFPYLERFADARGRVPRTYRIRVSAQFYVPRYAYDRDGIDVQVAPYDDADAPAFLPTMPTKIGLLPTAMYPYASEIPILRGNVIDTANAPVANAIVTWIDATLQTESVLSDADGEFSLPMRRAPRDTPIDIHAERPPPPAGGRAGDAIVRIPQDLPTFHTIQIS